ncbi:MAG: hypothetical protein KDK35_04980 [Leptospiraceae bacterium]|nr:hypothetical protein [Leptospiraceae bacterium]MCP5485916.1 hypothetical protein [Spirochaetales bacterium]
MHTDPAILRRQLRDRLASISRANLNTARFSAAGALNPATRDYYTRTLRAGFLRGGSLRIHHRQRLRRTGIYRSADQLASLLSRLEPASVDMLANRIEQYILIPELVHGNSHLMSHVYDPELKLLAIYLYPWRLDQEAVRRTPRIAPGPARVAGLLGTVIERICDPGFWPGDALESFVIPLSILEDHEMHELESTHELYLLSRT